MSFETQINEEKDNPYKNEEAEKVLEAIGAGSNPVIDAFTKKIPIFKNDISSEVDKPLEKFPFFLRSDVKNGFPVPEQKEINSINILKTYVEKDIIKQKSTHYELPVQKRQYITFELKQIDFELAVFEPILCTAFLYDGNDIISEYWSFYPDISAPFFSEDGKMKFSTKVGFQYEEVSPKVHFVILFHRIAQENDGEIVNKYYLSPNKKNMERAKQSFDTFYPRNKDVFITFAITSAPLTSIITSPSGFTFPSPCLCPDNPFASMKECIEKAKLGKSKIPFKVTMIPGVKNTCALEGYKPIAPIIRNLKTFESTFRNQAILRLNSATIKKAPSSLKRRNLYSVVSIQESSEGDKLPLLIDPVTQERVDELTGRMNYHNKSPVFDDLFVFDLPNVLPENLIAVVKIYNAHVNPQKNEVRDLIGVAQIPIFTNSLLTKKIGPSNYALSIVNEKTSDIQNNYISVNLSLDTSLYTNSSELLEFASGVMKEGVYNLDLLSSIDPIVLRTYLLPISAIIVSKISEHPYEGVSALGVLVNLVYPVYFGVTNTLVSFCQNIFGKKKNVFKGWAEYLKEIPIDTHGLDRKDINVSDALFMLNEDSNDLEFVEVFSESIAHLSENGLIQAKKLTSGFAKSLKDCPNAVEIIEKFIAALSNNPEQSEIIIEFLNSAFEVGLFERLVFESNYLQDICVRAVTAQESRPLQGLFTSIANAALGLPQERQTLVADKLIEIIDIISPISELPFSSDQDLHPAVILIIWLILAASDNKLRDFFATHDQSVIFSSIHFLINRTTCTISFSRTNAMSLLESQYNKFSPVIRNAKKGRSFSKRGLHNRAIVAPSNTSRELFVLSQTVVTKVVRLAKDPSEKAKLFENVLSHDLPVCIMRELANTFVSFLAENKSCNIECDTPIYELLHQIIELSLYTDIDFTAIANTKEMLAALSVANIEKPENILPESFRSFVNQINDLKNETKGSNTDNAVNAFFKLMDLFSQSQEAVYNTMNNLANYYSENSYLLEYIETKKAMLPKEKNIEEARLSLAEECIEKYFPEIAIQLLKGFEGEKEKLLLERAAQETEENHCRFFGRFFRVVFKKGSEREDWIYHEKNLTSLFNLVARLDKEYPDAVILKGTGEKVDEGQLAIEVSFVEPYFPKQEREGKTEFQMNYGVKKFKYDSPFTESKSVQGSVSEQFLRRKIVTSESEFPSMQRRIKVVSCEEKIIEPISVALKEINSRTKMCIEAANKNDISSARQLLHGSLIVQVNAGPAEIANTFFGSGNIKEGKLKTAFLNFLDALKVLLDIHEKSLEEMPSYEDMHKELVEGFNNLSELINSV